MQYLDKMAWLVQILVYMEDVWSKLKWGEGGGIKGRTVLNLLGTNIYIVKRENNHIYFKCFEEK